MKFPCASCGYEDHHDSPECGTCGGSVTTPTPDREHDIIPQQQHERLPPDTKSVENRGDGATILEIEKLRREVTLARSAANKRYAELLGELDRLKQRQAS